jgi:ferrous iron transport protein B
VSEQQVAVKRAHAVEHREGRPNVLVALAGQPNVGKSTVFNALTGLDQHVGNWPGKTVERMEGQLECRGETYCVVDLPGTYSLTANSPEEVIAREFVIRERPDVVVALVDAASLERSLYLVAELLALPAKVIVALNMMDVAEGEGLHVEPEVLEAALGVPVVPMIATKRRGVQPLVDAIDRVARGEIPVNPKPPRIREDHRHVLDEIQAVIAGLVPEPYPEAWIALKLLEGDREVLRLMEAQLPDRRWDAVQELLRAHDDALVAVASGRYEWIGRMMRAAVTRPKPGRIGRTERIDRWATHPVWGLGILGGVLALVFTLTYSVGVPLQEALGTYVLGGLGDLANSALAGAPAWLSSLVVDGVIGGAGFVATFLPVLAIFFAAMAVLEDVGYMARAAYVMDSFMHLIGLHGKSFLPLFLGFGCNVPAVLGARVIESRRSRLLTILLAPLVPCTARMAVVAFLAPAFFGAYAAVVSWGLILLTLVVLAVSGVVINRLVLKGRRSAFIMELPLYHVPNTRNILLSTWHRCVEFLKKAGTVILPVSIGVWVLSYLPGGEVETSYLAGLGRWIAPVGGIIGFDWRLIVALMTSFVASENSLASLGVLLGAEPGSGLRSALAAQYSIPAGLAFMAVQMLFVPCLGTVAAIKQESGSWGWTLFSILHLSVVSLLAGAGLYWIAQLGGL